MPSVDMVGQAREWAAPIFEAQQDLEVLNWAVSVATLPNPQAVGLISVVVVHAETPSLVQEGFWHSRTNALAPGAGRARVEQTVFETIAGLALSVQDEVANGPKEATVSLQGYSG